jgi:hypothetical protein
MTCESLFSLVFLKILGGREHSSKRLKEGNNSSLCSLRERERGKAVKKERKRERRAKQQNSRTERERVLSARERERERRRERILISQSRRRIDWSRPLLSGFYILSQQHQRSA